MADFVVLNHSVGRFERQCALGEASGSYCIQSPFMWREATHTMVDYVRSKLPKGKDEP